MKISLHLGAHKTASTYLQTAMERNAPLLARHRVGAVPLDDLRREVTRRVWRRPDWDEARQAKANRRAEKFLAPLLARRDIDRLVLSDENLIGTPANIVLEGTLYPDIATRLGTLPRLLKGHEVEVFLAVRPLMDFTRSVYCESLRAMLPRFVEPDEFRTAWNAAQPSWAAVLRQLRAVFPDAPITLWSHEAIRSDPTALLNALAGLAPETDYDLEQIYRRRSLSRRATELLLETGRREGTRAMADAAHAAGRDHPLGPDNWQYQLWPHAARRADRLSWPETYAALADAVPGVSLMPLPSQDP